MLLPYNVDRPTRGIPVVTYALIAANIFVFLMSVVVSNLSLSADRAAGKQAILALTAKDPATQNVLKQFDAPSSLDGDAPARNPALREPPAASELPADDEGMEAMPSQMRGQIRGQMGDDFGDEEASGFDRNAFRRMRALKLASEHIDTPAQYQRFWQIEHANASWVVDPHYSFMNAFAYRANDSNALHQLFSMLTSMFLHADIDHIAGNMLFLWIFGRAAEEFLGLKIYLPIYFFAGIAATLLNHFMTVAFAPQALGLPNLGASGAIAGVLGLFAVRFFRTKVRIFYLAPWAGVIAGIAFGVLFFPLLMTLRDPVAALTLALIGVLGAMFVFGREWVWGAFRAPSVWVIGAWVLVFNLAPALFQMLIGSAGGVAYWAHIGGFMLGALYALLIGGVEEGKTEYAIEDAQQSLSVPGGEAALQNVGQVLQKEPNNPRAHEIAARAYASKGNAAQATEHYQKALELFWKTDRVAAATLYVTAAATYPQLALRPALLLGLAGQLAQMGQWNEAVTVLCRLIEEFEGTPESEIALLRSAQMWLRHYGDAAEAERQLELFLSKYPHSDWRPQAQDALKAARKALAS